MPSITVIGFARLRELLGNAEMRLDLPDGARVADVWPAMLDRLPALAEFGSSTRIALNDCLADGSEALTDGDCLALLPPLGGG